MMITLATKRILVRKLNKTNFFILLAKMAKVNPPRNYPHPSIMEVTNVSLLSTSTSISAYSL
jgi:hypothetical protein